VVVETSNSGDLVPHVLHQFAPNLPVRRVTATRGKVTRAAPLGAGVVRRLTAATRAPTKALLLPAAIPTV
jgi:phage terminase large subunit-like protein